MPGVRTDGSRRLDGKAASERVEGPNPERVLTENRPDRHSHAGATPKFTLMALSP